MMRGDVRCPIPDHGRKGSRAWSAKAFLPAFPASYPHRYSWRKAGFVLLVLAFLFVFLGTMGVPLVADGNSAHSPPAGTSGDDFGQYLADHQSDLAPYFEKNASKLFKAGFPLLMGMMGWVIFFTMLAGWAIDILLSRGFAVFFAPAFAGIKRCVIYATGGLFLSFLYAGLLGLAMAFSLKMPHAGIVLVAMILLLFLVALAAQIVWILYLYRTTFSVSAVFYLAILVAHTLLGLLIAKPIVDWRASGVATDFVDQEITPGLQAEAQSTRHELAAVASSRDAIKAKVSDLQGQISQGQTEADQLRKEIEEKKNSDIYVLGEILKSRARDDLGAARGQLADFVAKFPSSPLNASARAQLAQVDSQMAAEEAQKKQGNADAARAAAQARADLLARAAQGNVTLSEMRKALLGKTRAQVSSMLGLPSETASDSWGYRQQMIVNPLTNERHGLLVYFNEGMVQGVDYNRNGGSQ